MTSTRKKKREKRSPLGNTLPAKYRTYPFMLTRWMTEIDNYARKKKHKTPRALRHPQN
jgi:hypothetical protein